MGQKNSSHFRLYTTKKRELFNLCVDGNELYGKIGSASKQLVSRAKLLARERYTFACLKAIRIVRSSLLLRRNA